MKIESAIEILTELLGSREGVLATLSEMLVSDCETNTQGYTNQSEIAHKLNVSEPKTTRRRGK